MIMAKQIMFHCNSIHHLIKVLELMMMRNRLIGGGKNFEPGRQDLFFIRTKKLDGWRVIRIFARFFSKKKEDSHWIIIFFCLFQFIRWIGSFLDSIYDDIRRKFTEIINNNDDDEQQKKNKKQWWWWFGEKYFSLHITHNNKHKPTE